MTLEEFQAVFHYLVDQGEVVLPYDLMPGSRPGGIVEIATEEAWNAYGWNPPQYMAHLPAYRDPDSMATPKLFWSVLVSNLDAAMTAQLRPRRLAELRDEGRERVTAAYEEATFYDEIELRLRHGHTHAQDLAREAVRVRYQTLKTIIEHLNYEGLQAFNVKDDSFWRDLP